MSHISERPPRTTRSSGATAHADFAAFADALESERRLIGELAGILRRQRGAVAASDLQAVDDSVFAVRRVLVTLQEARRRRYTIHQILGVPDVDPEELGGAQGARMADVVRVARDALREATLVLAREVDINRRVLQQALHTEGDPWPDAAAALRSAQAVVEQSP